VVSLHLAALQTTIANLMWIVRVSSLYFVEGGLDNSLELPITSGDNVDVITKPEYTNLHLANSSGGLLSVS
jgi:hypothetical protein